MKENTENKSVALQIIVSLFEADHALSGMEAIKAKFAADVEALKDACPKRDDAAALIAENKEAVISARIAAVPALGEKIKNGKTTVAAKLFAVQKSRILNAAYGAPTTQASERKKAIESAKKAEEQALALVKEYPDAPHVKTAAKEATAARVAAESAKGRTCGDAAKAAATDARKAAVKAKGAAAKFAEEVQLHKTTETATATIKANPEWHAEICAFLDAALDGLAKERKAEKMIALRQLFAIETNRRIDKATPKDSK